MARIRKSAVPKRGSAWCIGVYIRLSRDDGGDESLSVTNQRKIILEFIQDRFEGEEYKVVDYYVDDGRSGTTEEARPEFQRMAADIEAGKINCVICKTLSRCFRNYSDQGRFLEQFLPAHHCRFIATGSPYVDTYTDPECTQNMEIPINGLMNDRYAARTSADVRRTFDTKRRRGEFIGAFAPYGYQKDPENRNALTVDGDAAAIVRDIYRWFVREGMNMRSIARRLNELGIPNPTAYKRQKGLAYQSSCGRANDGMWGQKTVGDILKNQVYTGAMVQGRQAVISYKVHKRYNADPADWYVVENTHKAIIDRDLFDRAQALLQRDTRTAPGKGKVYLFAGLLRCADCGKAMVRNTSKKYAYYYCRTYREKSADRCGKHGIRADILEQAVLTAVQKQIELVDSLPEILEAVNAAAAAQSTRLDAVRMQKTRQLEQVKELLDSLYLDMKAGDLSREQYLRMKEKLRVQAEQLQIGLTHIREEQDRQAEGAGDPYLRTFLSCRNIQSLSRGLLVELVKLIYVHEDGSIDIEFNYVDQYRRIVELDEGSQKELCGSGGKTVP